MHFSTITIAAVALALGVSAAPTSGMKNGPRARQTSLVNTEIKVGVSGDQNIGVVLAEETAGSTAFGFTLADSVTLLSGLVEADSGNQFSDAFCIFTSQRLANSDEGNIACDLDTEIARGDSSQTGTVVSGVSAAQCMFCSFS